MKNSKREEIVSHSAKKLFNIVLDIQSYPEYIPWCTKMVVNEKKSDEIFADMYVKYKFILTQKFGSHVKFNKKELKLLILKKYTLKKKLTLILLTRACKILMYL